MKAFLTARVLGLAIASLLVMACNLIPLTPSLTLTVQTAPYTSSTVDIPYSYATLSSSSSDGTAECEYVLSKWSAQDGAYRQVDSSSTTMAKTGTLSFNLTTILGSATGSSDVDGLYSLSFVVYSGQQDKNGNPVAIPYLQTTKQFSVHTYSGPEIFTVTPAVLNVNNGAQKVKVTGLGFSSTTSLATLPASSVLTGSTYVASDSLTATIDPTTLSAGSNLSIYAADSQGSASPIYDVPVIGDVAISSVAPTGDSRYNSKVPVYIEGSYLGPWTSATITDSKGTTIDLHDTYTSGSYLFGYADLTSLVAGSATVTVKNPDGSSATYPFTVYN